MKRFCYIFQLLKRCCVPRRLVDWYLPYLVELLRLSYSQLLLLLCSQKVSTVIFSNAACTLQLAYRYTKLNDVCHPLRKKKMLIRTEDLSNATSCHEAIDWFCRYLVSWQASLNLRGYRHVNSVSQFPVIHLWFIQIIWDNPSLFLHLRSIFYV